MFANMSGFSIRADDVVRVKNITADLGSSRKERDYYLNEMSEYIVHKNPSESDAEYVERANSVGMMTWDEANGLVDKEFNLSAGVSLGSHIVAEPVKDVSSLDDYFNAHKENIESSNPITLDGASAVIKIDGDRSIDIKADKKTNPRDLAKFSGLPKSNPMAKGIEDMVLYPGALSFNPLVAFDDDWDKFNRGEIFNSYEKNGNVVTDWKKFSLKLLKE